MASYGERLFDRTVREINRDAALLWRRRFRGMLEEIAAVHPPRELVDLDDLADFVSSVIEGGIILSKAMGEPRTLDRRTLVLRTTVRALFTPARG